MTSSSHDKDVAHELRNMVCKNSVKMKARIFPERDQMSVIVFFQKFKWARDAREIHKGSSIWLFKQHVAVQIEVSKKMLATITNDANI